MTPSPAARVDLAWQLGDQVVVVRFEHHTGNATGRTLQDAALEWLQTQQRGADRVTVLLGREDIQDDYRDTRVGRLVRHLYGLDASATGTPELRRTVREHPEAAASVLEQLADTVERPAQSPPQDRTAPS